MFRISCVRMLAILIIAGSLLAANSSGQPEGKPEKQVETTKMDGAWRLIMYKPATAEDYIEFPKGWEQTKLVVGGHFVWTLVRDGKSARSAGGKQTIRGNEYTEEIEFVSDSDDEWMVGKTGTFKGKIVENKWHHGGTIKTERGDAKITEIWERLK